MLFNSSLVLSFMSMFIHTNILCGINNTINISKHVNPGQSPLSLPDFLKYLKNSYLFLLVHNESPAFVRVNIERFPGERGCSFIVTREISDNECAGTSLDGWGRR